MSQGDCTYDFDVCNNNVGYLNSMDDTFSKGMVFVLSHWGDSYGTMSWLDQKTGCGGDCDTSGHVTYSNWEIYTANTEEEFTQ